MNKYLVKIAELTQKHTKPKPVKKTKTSKDIHSKVKAPKKVRELPFAFVRQSQR